MSESWLIKKYIGVCREELIWIRRTNIIFPDTAIKNILKMRKQRRPGCEDWLKSPIR
jgi:hypothetical protein